MMQTKMMRAAMGMSTAASTYQPGMDRANMAAGKMKNINNRYTMENQRYLAVVLPRNFANGIGGRKNENG